MNVSSGSFHAGILSGSSPQSPDPDPEAPREEHDSHTWAPGPRWRACSRCATRDHWPAASVRCSGVESDGDVRLDLAIEAIAADLIAFGSWWIGRADLGLARPSLAEWRAEFLEWSRANGASARQ